MFLITVFLPLNTGNTNVSTLFGFLNFYIIIQLVIVKFLTFEQLNSENRTIYGARFCQYVIRFS